MHEICKASASNLMVVKYVPRFQQSLETSIQYVGQTRKCDRGKALKLLYMWRASGWFGEELLSLLESVLSDSSGGPRHPARQRGACGAAGRAVSEALASAEIKQLQRQVSDLQIFKLQFSCRNVRDLITKEAQHLPTENLASAEITQLQRQVSDLRRSGRTKAETIALMKQLLKDGKQRQAFRPLLLISSAKLQFSCRDLRDLITKETQNLPTENLASAEITQLQRQVSDLRS